MSKSKRLATLLALLLFPGTACSSGNAGKVATPSQTPVSPSSIKLISDPNEVSRPIDAFLPTLTEMEGLGRIYYKTFSNCVKGKGGTPAAEPDSALQGNAQIQYHDRILRSYLWGFFDVADASIYGYEHPTSVLGNSGSYQLGDIPQATAVSCTAAASEKLGGLDGADDEKTLPDGGPTIPLSDSRYLNVVSKWKQCMAAKGFNYNDPISAIELGRGSGAQSVPGQRSWRPQVK